MVPDRAFGLQKVVVMKRFVVGILAALLVTACGIGVDEGYEDEVLFGESADALGAASADGGSVRPPPPVFVPIGWNPRGLPQDPVPVKPDQPLLGGWAPPDPGR